MHSLYAVKKREIDSQVADQLRRRTDPSNPALHRLKTRRLAENYESRIDGWLAQTSESKIEPLAKQRLACHHTFRERSVDMELANPRVSPMNYIYERTRIDKEVSQGDSSLVMLDRWTQKSGSLFREREPGKEIQPPLVFPRCMIVCVGPHATGFAAERGACTRKLCIESLGTWEGPWEGPCARALHTRVQASRKIRHVTRRTAKNLSGQICSGNMQRAPDVCVVYITGLQSSSGR
eukprot:Tamp_12579.p3 GENE.Tamp_12579~~Tamp_12579.p3  ORF type:complete len:247 (+),score=19.63 Tamp_12579:34-741(+)